MSKDEAVDTVNCGDINDIFDSITFVEENLASNGFKEGFEKGKVDGEFEGYHLGYHRGAEIGAEVGYYKGFLEALIKTGDSDFLTQHSGIINKLNTLIESYPQFNDETNDLIALRDSIRSTYKRLCSLLKIGSRIPDNTQLNF